MVMIKKFETYNLENKTGKVMTYLMHNNFFAQSNRLAFRPPKVGIFTSSFETSVVTWSRIYRLHYARDFINLLHTDERIFIWNSREGSLCSPPARLGRKYLVLQIAGVR